MVTTVNLQTNVRNGKNGIKMIDFDGEVTGFAEETMMDAYQQASQEDTGAIILNFEKLEYLNSSGIGLLVTILIRA